ncbi:merozoite surface protein 9, putative [Plasmodium berghei]|uniref:Merozoite surface protein 9, putative n=2 Tax=Plasmodium berghei TaxID=5821 RepID=A0A509B0Y3_PLABA|nr:merozoite surface protein 9, putative [Plasmodium berghei ANKA]AAQ73545.1 merozoite surface protein 9 precursor [Plasmodium berghei]SCM26741.1 merozoite surface protein 9, putative [Plasmodium berghei]SCN28613.1 merozoite surface protein 9, putative [Plasmodium berghei]SCO64361.1 merozoite surface protein 9, putative [Plasmodium berghei]VUC58494.1 merozoite surface protein 9, putative [Plasmodium berghei ANKA]|eukprot:XP_034424257.1 merozoite surface protein 9, putative [Plasmodium berghei ANKA]
MKISIVAFPLLMIALRSKSTNAHKTNNLEAQINYGIINNYNELLKVAKCQYCLTTTNPVEEENCDEIMEECRGLLSNKDLGFLLKAITDESMHNKSQYIHGKHSNTLRRIIKVLEAQKKNIESVKNIVRDIKKSGNTQLRSSGTSISDLDKLNTSIKNIKKGFQFLNDNYSTINKHINIPSGDMNKIYKRIVNTNNFDGLSKSQEKICSNEDDTNVGIDDIIKSSVQDIFDEGENIMNVVKTVLVQESDGIGNELAGLIEKGKEIGEQIVNIEGLLSPKNGLFSGGLPSLNKLYEFTSNLSSYEYLLVKLKDSIISKLKDILLRLLYKSYITYRKNKSIELGEEEIPMVSKDEYLDELKKGVIQLSMKLLYSKIKRLLIKIKNKMSRKKKTENIPDPLPVESSIYDYDDDDAIVDDTADDDAADDDVADNDKFISFNKSSSHMKLFRGILPQKKSIVSTIDKMISEIDLYEQGLYTDTHADYENDEILSTVEGMDETESDEAELSNECVQKIIDENIAVEAINNLLKVDESAVEERENVNDSENKSNNSSIDIEKGASTPSDISEIPNIIKKIVIYVIKERIYDLAEELSDNKLEDESKTSTPSNNIILEDTPAPNQA